MGAAGGPRLAANDLKIMLCTWRSRTALLAGVLAAWLGALGCQSRSLPLRSSYHAAIYVAGSAFHSRRVGELWAFDAMKPALKNRQRMGSQPIALAFNPARNELYCLNQGSRDLSILDVVNRRLVGRIRLRATPLAMTLSPDHLYALIAARIRRQGWIFKIDLPSRTIVARRQVGTDPVALATNLSGTRLLVADATGSRVWVLNNVGSQLRQPQAIALPGPPTQIQVLPYGPQAFVLCPGVNQVSVLNIQPPALVTNLTVGHQPQQMVLKPDGGELYVSNSGDGTISIIDTATDEVSGMMLAGANPMGMAISNDGRHLMVANAGSNTVSLLRLSDRKTLANIPVGMGPQRLIYGPYGLYVYVLDAGSNDIAVVRPDLATMVTLLPSPPHASAICLVAYHQPPAQPPS